jgi:hypothetical protein
MVLCNGYNYSKVSLLREAGALQLYGGVVAMSAGARIALGFTLLVSVVLLFIFLRIYVPAISDAREYKKAASWTKNEQKTAAATGLASLIGGIVALGFGMKPRRTKAGANGGQKKKVQRSLMGLGDTLTL